MAPDKSLSLEGEIAAIKTDLAQYGYDIQAQDGSTTEASVKSTFIKDNSLTRILSVKNNGGHFSTLKIKVEVDSNPPEGSKYEKQTQLCSGKLHAILCRKYTKGRDLFDLLWYLGKNIRPNLLFLENALKQMGPWAGSRAQVTNEWLFDHLRAKMAEIDFSSVRVDLRRFLRERDLFALDSINKETILKAIEKSDLAQTQDKQVSIVSQVGSATCRVCSRQLKGQKRQQHGVCSICDPQYLHVLVRRNSSRNE